MENENKMDKMDKMNKQKSFNMEGLKKIRQD